ncbi:hypothetical protein CO657_31245 (plasmid) [Rhizobium acidisoli]|uniref:DUF6894 domain-containing protein n=2 Tax=Rhizobium acidisoli TaxID=1538158 RepID=A0AAE5WTK3_9HYPH|nr:hypothetical protein [Rhizobium acidisoli]KPH04206.1 hypothetical protein AOG23_34575 [Rhizobium acidisoli]QAS82283.1 hypothetical protein CO657_31245 [Rhizobium acidisoli]
MHQSTAPQKAHRNSRLHIFHLITPVGAVNDLAKADFASLDDARAEAMALAKEYMRRAAGDGRDVSGYAIEICNEAGITLSVVTFRQAR